jgi:LuxR family maltose regulon positive regulatory protein
LVLDDYHLIEAPAVHASVEFLLDRLPPGLRLVVATRADPPLPLARLRGRGQLAELRERDLRFTLAETAAFLREVTGLDLPAASVAALQDRTEGWAAGVQLAALSLQGQADPAGFVAGFSGSNRYILDYLTEEVLARQPEPVVGFLLETSILERLSGPLCDAVTGRTDTQQTLEQLERANLFLVALDDVCPSCTGPRPPGMRRTGSPTTPSATPWPPAIPPGRPAWSSGTWRRCCGAARAPPLAAG